MSWEHREYAQSGPWRDRPRFAGLLLPSGATRWLILAHLGAFFVLLFVRPAATVSGGNAGDAEIDAAAWPIAAYISGIGSYTPPRPLTVLLHAFTPAPERILGGLLLVIFTCFVIGSLGALVEERVGPARMLLLYLLGNTFAGAAYIAAVLLAPTLARAPLDHPVGAFAAWGLWAIRSMQFEHAPVFGRMYSVSRIVAVSAGIMILLEWMAHGLGTTLWVVAMAAGALPALLLAPLERMMQGREARRVQVARPAIRKRARAAEPERTRSAPSRSAEVIDDIDAILAKISREGMASLTDSEREKLEQARRARLSGRSQ